MRFPAAATLALLVLTASPAGVTLQIGPADIQRALALARRPDAERARFHGRYVLRIGDPTADRVEVISELRRVVLAAEDRLRIGDHLFSVRDAESLLVRWRQKVSILARLRFHPQHAYVTVPPYDLALAGGAGQPGIRPVDLRRVPQYSMPGNAASSLVGAVIEGVFDAAPLSRARRRLIVSLSGKPVATVTIDFAAIE